MKKVSEFLFKELKNELPRRKQIEFILEARKVLRVQRPVMGSRPRGAGSSYWSLGASSSRVFPSPMHESEK